MSEDKKVLLEVQKVKKEFVTSKSLTGKPLKIVHAVDSVDLTIYEGETIGVVGESGCGKSTLGRCILQLIRPTAGNVLYRGEDITKLNKEQMRQMRRKMQLIFQDPYASLNPRMTIGEIIAEPLNIQKRYKTQEETRAQVLKVMEVVGLNTKYYNRYPHEFSGGQRQRIGIARAIVLNPSLVVCDEPVSALDVSIQAQILNLLQDLKEQMGLTFIFITHDLSVVNHFADEIAVMYLGQLIEKAPTEELFDHPIHPYTRALLSAIPIPEVGISRPERILLKGEISSPIDPPDECRFAKRCIYTCDQCHQSCPKLMEVRPGHFVSCHLWKDFLSE